MNQGRSATSGRSSSSGRPSTSGKSILRPPTAMRPISVTSSGGLGPIQGLNVAPPITVADRPMTQHGLGGLKTGTKPLRRTVQDKSYFMGIIRSKIGELSREVQTLDRESDNWKQEQTTHKSYDHTATELASEIKQLLEEMADYNTAADKLSTDTAIDDVRWEFQQLKQNNEVETKMNENLFLERQKKEEEVEHLQSQIDKLRVAGEKLITNMKPEVREKYRTLKNENNNLHLQTENLQLQIQTLNEKKLSLEQEIIGSDIKQEALNLHGKIRDLEEKHHSFLEEERLRGTPAEEREKLLKQVKEDNLEISTMEKHSKDLKDQINKINDAIAEADEDLETAQSERNQQYLELRKREEMMNNFLSNYDETFSADITKKFNCEAEIVKLLEKISFNLIQCQQLPTFGDLQLLKDDFDLNQVETDSPRATVKSLLFEKRKQIAYLRKMDELDNKMSNELDDLKAKIISMEKEIITFENIDKLRQSFKEKETQWENVKVTVSTKMESNQDILANLSSENDEFKKQLNENEAHIQLGNLERKWQHLEQNNFAIKQYIEKVKSETNYSHISESVLKQFSEYNTQIITNLSKR